MVFYLGTGAIDTTRQTCFDPTQGESRWQAGLRDWLAESEGCDPPDWTMAAATGQFTTQDSNLRRQACGWRAPSPAEPSVLCAAAAPTWTPLR